MKIGKGIGWRGKKRERREETAQNKLLKDSDLTIFSLKRRKGISEKQNKGKSKKGEVCVYKQILKNMYALRNPSETYNILQGQTLSPLDKLLAS